MNDPILETLQKHLARLPGMGPRSAKRVMLDLLLKKQQKCAPLIEALTQAYEHAVFCQYCFNLSSENPCSLCTDPKRDQAQICVVETIADLWAMERANIYYGLYHVLGGVMSALDGVTPDDLTISHLVERSYNDHVMEVILATNVTLEGQTTANYITKQLDKCNVKVTRLAHGLPAGGELDYMDEGTLKAALYARDRLL